jgi:mRNA interferase RelE/StbE
MAVYKVYFRESVEKDLVTIPKRDLKRILQRVKMLEDNPRPPGSEKLIGPERYRVRQGQYRIVYSIQDDEFTAWIVKVGHRKEVCR